MSASETFVIVGRTPDGRKFRPSDWPDRLCGALSSFGDFKKLRYSPFVSPGDYDGEKAVFVDGLLHEADPGAYDFVCGFAADNHLEVLSGVCLIEEHTRNA
ncbi:MAG: DUF3579 domain-containing protein [Zoogloeaceae bacterium]|jgi:hypothetical protein|nr:DUF3579 domain-containing protein [Zoogloeaceae bacterium]